LQKRHVGIGCRFFFVTWNFFCSFAYLIKIYTEMRLSRLVSVVTAIVAIALGAAALDLPTKTLNGTKYYYYKVKQKETVYGISKKLGLTREEIIANNPAADDGVKKGMVLYFPFDQYSPDAVAEVAYEEEAPVDTASSVVIGIVEDSIPAARQSIAILLPFGLDNTEPTRDNRLALDFYKGFLMAADTLADRPGAVDIYAIDIDVDSLQLEEVMQYETVTKASVIVAPNNVKVYNMLADVARANGNYVLNNFIVADSLYQTNPQVLQANIPHREMYRLAVDAFDAEYAGFTPIVLRSKTGRNEKEPFVAYLTERCRNRGIEPIEIEYESNLVSADVERLDVSAGRKYVVVPSSGSLAEFNKFAYVVRSLRDRLAATVQTDDSGAELPRAQVEVFGYPDWTAFRGDALDLLHKLDAMVYSRFFDNFGSFESRSLEDAFKRWYGTPVIESIPSQAFLGYDTGCYLIRNLETNGDVFDPLSPRSYTGVQSTFDFDKSGAGYSNSALYIIKYNADGTVSARVI